VTLPGPELPLGAVAPLDSPPDDELPDDDGHEPILR